MGSHESGGLGCIFYDIITNQSCTVHAVTLQRCDDSVHMIQFPVTENGNNIGDGRLFLGTKGANLNITDLVVYLTAILQSQFRSRF